jgi:hypothetical protein
MFKLGTTSGDYHHEINFDKYERWLKIKLIPNLLPISANEITCSWSLLMITFKDTSSCSSGEEEEGEEGVSEEYDGKYCGTEAL